MTASQSCFVLKPARRPGEIDLAEVRRALAVFADPAAGCFVQGLPWAHWECLPGKDLDGLVKAVERIAGASGTYFGLNPCPVNEKPINKTVLRRRWMLLDWDCVPAHVAEHNATDEEREEVRTVALAAMESLAGRGFTPPVVVDSGRGTQLLYRVDLENTQLAHQTIKAVLQHVARRHDRPGRVTLGVECCDARRIAKLPGTWACKGEPTKERPGRLARLVYVPDTVEVVDAELLSALAREDGPGPGMAPATLASPAENSSAFVLRAGETVGGRCARTLRNQAAIVACAPSTTRNVVLNRSCYTIGGMLWWGVLNRRDVENEFTLACHKNGLYEENGLEDIADRIKRGLDAGAAKPLERPRELPQPGPNGRHADLPADLIVWAHTVTPKKIEWLWPWRIPLGKLTTFAGVGGLGKTFALLDIAARVTAGKEWPFADGELAETGRVLFVSGEDEPDDTLVPRLIECGADLTRVAFLKSEVQDQLTLRDIPLIEAVLDRIGVDIRFVAIDPPTAFLGDVDDHKNAELRQLLSPLKSLAARRRVAIVFNTHVTKPQGAKVDAMMRVMGSVAWVNAVRAAHMFARDPHDPDRRLFVGMKMNVGPERKGLAYRLAMTSELAKIEWLAEVDTTADEAVNRETPKRRGLVASEYLAGLFDGRDEVPSREAWDRKNRETTVSDNAFKEAKEEMGIRAKRTVDGDGSQAWVWYWPQTARAEWALKNAGAKGDVAEF